MYSSDEDEPDLELLELLRNSLTVREPTVVRPQTHVVKSAYFIEDNSIDVAIQRDHVIKAADDIWEAMQKNHYSTEIWSEQELHPKAKDEDTLNFIFLMDLLNFSFWSELPQDKRFSIEYRGKRWTGYSSLVAVIQRALDEGIPITCPYFWVDEEVCTDALLRYIFRSAGEEDIPLLSQRITMMRIAGDILCERYDGRFANCVKEANKSAAALVMLLVTNFSECFDDSHQWHGKTVRFYKRAQILVADVWACFNKTSYGTFTDIASITMFADYRVPVTLHTLGCLRYSPTLTTHIYSNLPIPSGHTWEIQLRGCTISCVEKIKKMIEQRHPESRGHVNSILIDFYLYDTAKELEKQALAYEEAGEVGGQLEIRVGTARRVVKGGIARDWEDGERKEKGMMIPNHRTRTIWY
ncbi:hypothetical protein DFH27DRAFT_549786 [Peziza echinospora]|nr:hypothetical protein DFH27DRAFT_549786 [Peziza echinospora]